MIPCKMLHDIRLFVALCCLLAVLAACSVPSPSGTGGGQTPEPTKSNTRVPTVTPATSTTTTPAAPTTVAAQASCPAAGTARAAVMPSLALASPANIVYTYQSFSSYQYQGQSYQDVISYLKLYDVTSGAKNLIATIAHSRIDSYSATLSPDGQWIMFETYTDVHPLSGFEFITVLQLVRIDGQHLQTLFCGTPLNASLPDDYAAATSWSPNQKALLFNQLSIVQNRGTEMLYLLDLTSGNLQQEVQANQTNVASYKWLDNTRAFLSAHTGPPGSPGLLLLDTSKGPGQQEASLQNLVKAGQPCQSYEISPDNAQLFVGQCNFDNNGVASGPSTLSVELATGGTPQTIFTSQQLAICSMEMISSTTLLLLVCNTTNTGQNGWWEIHIDGSGLTRLQAAGDYTMFLPIIARDGNMYTLGTYHSGEQSLGVGTLNGGTPKSFATTTVSQGEVGIVGWAM
ncbi:MAG: hypothetical protein E6I93_14170 [Chloroflexi bacterium]|nr:MAG: hypothetical protein E6I93_14170 [Chloroflexota bacterium]